MPKVVSPRMKAKRPALASFTLIELLTVIAIIAILATLVLAAASGLETTAARKRAMTEIDGYSIALNNYKKDNGIYPQASYLIGPPNGSYPLDPSDGGGPYQSASQTLYTALSGGQTQFSSTTGTAAPTTTVYFPFSKKQVGQPFGPTYVQDPWGYAYGYSTGNPSNPPAPATDPAPYNGAGFFDLWSTGGTTGNANGAAGSINTWVVNWQ